MIASIFFISGGSWEGRKILASRGDGKPIRRGIAGTVAVVGYADERLGLIARLRSSAPGLSISDALRLDARALRFHLGTSLADLRVPVHLDERVRSAVNAAVRDLFFLLSVRHRAVLRPDEYDRLILLDGFDPRAARQVSFNAPSSVKSENVRRAFLEAPELHPALDGGLVASWLAAGRAGRALAGTLNALLRRAQAETQGREPPEPTAYLVLLSLRALSRAALETLKDLPMSGPAGRVLHGAVAAGLLIALRLATRESAVLDGQCGPACEAAVSALPWLGGSRLLWGSSLGCYGVPFVETPARLEQHVQEIAQGGTPEAVARDVAADLAGSKEAMRRASRQVGLSRVRADLLSVLRMAEVGRAPTFSVEGQSLAQLYQAPAVLERVLATPASRKELHEKTRAAAKAAAAGPARDAIESVTRAAKEWKDDDAGGWMPREQIVRTWATAVAVLAVDSALDWAVGQAEMQVAHRLGGESEGGVEVEHEAGKLYLFGLEEGPILMTRSRAPHMGHLFCDMKDFTKRTAFLKETVIADFLSREFYGPILTAAARHAQGAAHLADKGGIYLNNLLGDAVSFSGDIVALLELAQDIRAALGSYGRRLDKEGSREAVANVIASIEEKFKDRRKQLGAAVKSAQEAQLRGIPDPISGEEPASRLRALEAELSRLEEERAGEIALASGEKLEAGIFVSYGAPPEVARFEDHIFGQIKVSIAEKINESARGTARNAGVRARVEQVLASERARLGRPSLVCPLHVSVSQPLSMPVPEHIATAMRRSIAGGDLEGAEAVLSGVVRQFVAGLASQEMHDDRGDIYNGGAAVSEDALEAYVEARSDLVFLRREVQVGQLAPALREKFVFPANTLRVVMAVSSTAPALQQLFVYVGRALFRGFEKQGGLGVFEMIAREAPFFGLLAQHHLGPWLAEHQAGAGGSADWSARPRRSSG
jgi:hypothetical protein